MMTKKLKIEAVIFDMDGLMIDTESIAKKAFDQAMKVYNYDYDPELFISLIGCDSTNSNKILKAHYGDGFPIAKICRKMSELETHHVQKNGINKKAGIIELLTFLEANHIPKGVGTSTSYEKAIKKLELTGIKPYFTDIVGGNQVKNGKPSPDIFLAVAEKLGKAPEHCLVLEDSEPGIKAAVAANMIPIMIPDLKQPSQSIQEIVYKILPDHFHVIALLKTIL